MAITGVTQQQYLDFISQGGILVFEIDRNDIDVSGTFESNETLTPMLDTGFQLPPSATAVADTSLQSPLNIGDPWTRIVTFVYRQKGTITYKRLPDGRYHATATFEKLTS